MCIVLLTQFTIKESIPEKSVMCTMEWYFFWSLAYHVAFVSFICADDMCARDVAELAAEEGSSSLSQFTLRDEPFCWAYSNTFRVIGDYFMLLVWVVPHAFCMLFSKQLFGCPNILERTTPRWSTITDGAQLGTSIANACDATIPTMIVSARCY